MTPCASPNPSRSYVDTNNYNQHLNNNNQPKSCTSTTTLQATDPANAKESSWPTNTNTQEHANTHKYKRKHPVVEEEWDLSQDPAGVQQNQDTGLGGREGRGGGGGDALSRADVCLVEVMTR